MQIHLEETVGDQDEEDQRCSQWEAVYPAWSRPWALAPTLGKMAEYSGVCWGFQKQRAKMERLSVPDWPGLHSETQLRTKSRIEVIQRKKGNLCEYAA